MPLFPRSLVPVAVSVSALGFSPLGAQKTAVIPSDHADVEGRRVNTIAHVSGGARRTQFIIANVDLSLPHLASITDVGFRQDGDSALAGAKIEMSISMGTAKVTVAKPSTRFADNYAATPKIVLARKWVSLPTRPKPTTKPGPHVLFALDTPHRFDSSKNLIVDYFVFANDRNNKTFAYGLDQASGFTLPPPVYFGKGCGRYNGFPPNVSTFPNALGGRWSMDLLSGPPNARSLLMLGASKTLLGGKIPLPLRLDSLGASGCQLFTDPVLQIPTVTAATGRARINTTIPNNPQLHLQPIYAQWLCLDANANRAGFVTSNASTSRFALWQVITRLSGPVASQNGFSRSSGTVAVFRYR